MILKARKVRLSREDRAVLEARCRATTTAQRDVRRARIVLLAADGTSTRAIARMVGVEEAVVSTWRNRFADHGLEGLKDQPRPGKTPRYTAEADKRILKVLDEPPPDGYARWTGPLIATHLGDVHEQHVWRVLRKQKIDLSGANPGARAAILTSSPRRLMLSGSIWRRLTTRSSFASMRSPRSKRWSAPRAISNCPAGGR